MEKGMGTALSALRKQVQAGISREFNESVSPEKTDHPVKIGDVLARAEIAREELLNSGYRPG